MKPIKKWLETALISCASGINQCKPDECFGMASWEFSFWDLKCSPRKNKI